jgi:methylmalonyl-CoA mutase C-terminal domain/subunit
MRKKKIRVLIAKPGLDGHETGAKIIARALMEAGMEVIYTGARQTPEMIVKAAIEEDVDVLGLSILSGAHKELCSRIIKLFGNEGINNFPIIVGGIIPDFDVPAIKKMGVLEVFGPGTTTSSVVEYIKGLAVKAG